MPTYETDNQPAVSTLVSGIVDDAKQLFVEQLTLFQVEIRHDINRAISALVPLFVGVLVLFAAVVLLTMGFAHLLCWLFPNLPLWGGFLIVGALVAAAGGALLFWAKSMLSTVHPLPETALKGLKENLQWKTKN